MRIGTVGEEACGDPGDGNYFLLSSASSPMVGQSVALQRVGGALAQVSRRSRPAWARALSLGDGDASCDAEFVHRNSERDGRNIVSTALRRIVAGVRLRVTVARRDAVDLVPVADTPTWIEGVHAHEVITSPKPTLHSSET